MCGLWRLRRRLSGHHSRQFQRRPFAAPGGRFAAGGAGLANGIPLAYSAAGKFPGLPPGVGIAGVATIGYAAFLAGPPVIGLVADATSLRVSLVLAALLVGSIGFTAQAMRPQAQQATAPLD